jgi:hypothetical protein
VKNCEHLMNDALLCMISNRSVYDGPAPEKFLDRLDARIKAHNKEIERMCNHHYQGFIESVHSLLQVRGDVEKLKVSCLFLFMNTELKMS